MTNIYELSEKIFFYQGGNQALKALGNVDTIFNRIISIGDVHGCLESLIFLLDNIKPTKKDLIVFLGDYVDRGPNSPGVIEYLLDLKEKYQCVFLRGNHDSMMLNYLRVAGIFGEYWTDPRNGGNTTLAQYKVSSVEAKYANRNVKVNYTLERIVKNKIPTSHVEFLRNTLLFFEMDHAFYSHAGFDLTSLERYDDQNEEAYTWTREDFIGVRYTYTPPKLVKHVVHGHTINSHDFLPYYLVDCKQINLDSGCYKKGTLSALIVDPKKNINESMFAVSNVEETKFMLENIQSPRYAK